MIPLILMYFGSWSCFSIFLGKNETRGCKLGSARTLAEYSRLARPEKMRKNYPGFKLSIDID